MATGSSSTIRCGNLSTRLTAGAVAVACLALLLTAAMLEPDAAGYGTHTQLGIDGCRWLADRNFNCPTCGMTTAFALSADGNIPAAFMVQPAGALGAMLVAMTFWVAGYISATGQNVARGLAPLWNWRTLAAAVAIVMLAWAYRIAIMA